MHLIHDDVRDPVKGAFRIVGESLQEYTSGHKYYLRALPPAVIVANLVAHSIAYSFADL